MQTIMRRLEARRRLRLVLAAVLVSAATLDVAPAYPQVTCHATGTGTGFQAFRVDVPSGGAIDAIVLTGQHIPAPVADKSNYYATEGIEVFNAKTGVLQAYGLRGITGQRPRAVVSSGSQTKVAVDLVGPGISGGGWSRENYGGPAQTNYVVGFGFGFGNYDVSVTISGASACVPVTPTSFAAVHYDQTDFDGNGADVRQGGQIYAVAAGGGGNLTKEFPVTKNFFAGYFQTGFADEISTPGPQLTYNTPNRQGLLQHGDSLAVTSLSGTYSFSLRYGPMVLQEVTIDGWMLDLPIVP